MMYTSFSLSIERKQLVMNLLRHFPLDLCKEIMRQAKWNYDKNIHTNSGLDMWKPDYTNGWTDFVLFELPKRRKYIFLWGCRLKDIRLISSEVSIGFNKFTVRSGLCQSIPSNRIQTHFNLSFTSVWNGDRCCIMNDSLALIGATLFDCLHSLVEFISYDEFVQNYTCVPDQCGSQVTTASWWNAVWADVLSPYRMRIFQSQPNLSVISMSTFSIWSRVPSKLIHPIRPTLPPPCPCVDSSTAGEVVARVNQRGRARQ